MGRRGGVGVGVDADVDAEWVELSLCLVLDVRREGVGSGRWGVFWYFFWGSHGWC